MASDGEILQDARGDAAPSASGATPDSALPWEQRILQLDGRRYSLRLEHEFWSALEAVAARRKLRLNRLIAEIAARPASEGNLSSRLRVFCLGEMQRSAAGRSLAIDRAAIAALVETAPTPALLVDAEQIALAINDEFVRWSGVKRAHLLRQKLAGHFRFQEMSSFEGLWTGPLGEVRTRIVGVTPGRVVAASARLVPMFGARGRRLCVVWVMV
ncbi:MAG TPA: ribbon-helix-helix domain-containing protein [Stellaceae bacterium]|nr:ribbon-helix-helix domain-containing protein [Stellaceae bacterium]